MPSGRVHAIFSLAAGGLAGGAVYATTRDVQLAVAVGVGSVAGIVLSPDLDEIHPTTSHNEVRRGCGMLPAAIWWFLWLPYTRLVTRHRSFLSHFPLISTAGRVGYLGAIGLPILWLVTPYLNGLSAPRIRIETGFFNSYLDPLWDAISTHLQWHIPVPGMDVWVVCLILFVGLSVLGALKVDMPQQRQKALFWIELAGISLVIALIFVVGLVDSRVIQEIPLGGWLLAGLCLSDVMHAQADWYLPAWL